MSGSADGLIRLWTIRTGECENTFDAHTDKVWALETVDLHAQTVEAISETAKNSDAHTETNATDAHTESAEAISKRIRKMQSRPLQQGFFSAGSDSTILTWLDVTEEHENTRVKEIESTLAMEQQLQNHLRNKDYHAALACALTLKHSLKVLGIFQAILEDYTSGSSGDIGGVGGNTVVPAGVKKDLFSLDWSIRLDAYVRNLADAQIEAVVVYACQWNTNAKHTYTVQLLLSSLLRIVKVILPCIPCIPCIYPLYHLYATYLLQNPLYTLIPFGAPYITYASYTSYTVPILPLYHLYPNPNPITPTYTL